MKKRPVVETTESTSSSFGCKIRKLCYWPPDEVEDSRPWLGGRAYDAVDGLWEQLADAGDAEGAEGVAHEAGLGEATLPQNLSCGRCDDVDALGAPEGAQRHVGQVHEDQGVAPAGLQQLPQEPQVRQLHGTRHAQWRVIVGSVTLSECVAFHSGVSWQSCD